MQFKVSIHCGQVNTFQIVDGESKDDILSDYVDAITNAKDTSGILRFGDLLINVNLITFVVVEEVQEVSGAEEKEAITLEA